MTREELKEHCLKQVEMCEKWAKIQKSSGKVYEEHKLILELLEQESRWIPVSERLPKDLEPVNVTWVNHNPGSYYADIKDKPFTATGHYCNGRWWWYSVTCQDYLNEYGRCDVDAMDDDIEVLAWMPLPTAYREVENE